MHPARNARRSKKNPFFLSLALIFCFFLTAVALIPIMQDRKEPYKLEVQISQIPASPLSAREGSSGLHFRDEFVVWGGTSGTGKEIFYHSDGAVYNRESKEWRTLPDPSFQAPNGHVAAAYKKGIFVLEVPSPRKSEEFSPSGAYLDLEQLEWSSISDPPFMPGESFLHDGVDIGGILAFPAGRNFHFYTPENDSWEALETPNKILRILPLQSKEEPESNHLFYSVEESERGIIITQRDVRDFSFARSIQVPDSEKVSDYGVTTTEDNHVYFFLRVEDEIRVTRTAGPDAERQWESVDAKSASHYHPPFSTVFPDDGLIFARGNMIISSSPLGFSLFDQEGGEYYFRALESTETLGCGASSARMETEEGLIFWGGQSCRPNEPGQVDTGYEVVILTPAH
jgi:hypothetical protein